MPVKVYDIEMLWKCSLCSKMGNRGLADRYCINCGHKKDASDHHYMPEDTSTRAALTGKDAEKAKAGPDVICQFCSSVQNASNKCCGNCGSFEMGRERVIDDVLEPDSIQDQTQHVQRQARTQTDYTATKPEREWAMPKRESIFQRYKMHAIVSTIVVTFVGLLYFLLTPKYVNAAVSQVYWQHEIDVERYALRNHDGFAPSFDAVNVRPLGERIHHYDKVLSGQHTEYDNESYVCGETCTTTPKHKSCSSNANGTARCTESGGDRVCRPKHCTRRVSRTVNDYKQVPRYQMYYTWAVWEWHVNRTATHSGFKLETTWPSNAELRITATFDNGEKEREGDRRAYYKVTFLDKSEGETYTIKPNSQEFQRYQPGKHFQLKVNRLGSVEVMP